MPCPYYGELIEEQQPIERKTNKKHSSTNPARIMVAAGNWQCGEIVQRSLDITHLGRGLS